MPKYWGKQIFTHGRFPKVGQKQKTHGARKANWAKMPIPPQFVNNNCFVCLTL